jgi:hypothetical protein
MGIIISQILIVNNSTVSTSLTSSCFTSGEWMGSNFIII